MLNKPKFMSPSINMYGNSVIDLNSGTLPFSCIVDGNETITDFQIVVSKLNDNTIVFDTGMKTLDKPFFPINNRNQNVVFSINLKDYLTNEAQTYYKPATSTYDETKTYYKLENGEYTISNPSSTNWSANYKNYHYVDFVNSVDAYYWTIIFKNSNSGTETHSVAEVFYANDIPRVEILYDSGKGEYAPFSNNLVYNGDTLKYSIGWTAEGCSFENANEGYLRLISRGSTECICHRGLEKGVSGLNTSPIVYCSAQVRGFKTNSKSSVPSCSISYNPGGDLAGFKYLEKIHESEIINDGKWHTLSIWCEANYENGWQFRFNEVATEIKNASMDDMADFKDICVFNLTEIYGKGNEPPKEWCDNNLDSLRTAKILSKRCKFKAEYIQKQNIPVKRYGWRLSDASTGFVIMDTITQNQIYGISDDISCACNGFMNKTKYILELYIETQNGYFDILQSMAFYTEYMLKPVDADFEIVALNDTAGIMLNWGNLKTTEGVVVGDRVSYIEDFPIRSTASIEIPDGTSIVFTGTSNDKDLIIDENSYVVLSFQTKKSESKILFEMSGEDEMSDIITRKLEIVASVNSSMLQYTVRKGDIIARKQYPLTLDTDELGWYIVTLPPLSGETIDFKLTKSTAIGGLFPSDNLYPVDLYTYDKSGNVIQGEYNKASSDYDQNLTYFKLVDGELVEYEYDKNTWSSEWTNLYCCLYPYFGEWDKLRNQEVV